MQTIQLHAQNIVVLQHIASRYLNYFVYNGAMQCEYGAMQWVQGPALLTPATNRHFTTNTTTTNNN